MNVKKFEKIIDVVDLGQEETFLNIGLKKKKAKPYNYKFLNTSIVQFFKNS